MALPSIGGQSFISISGRPDLLGQKVEEITRPNVDRHAWRTTGLRAEPTSHTCQVDVVDLNTAAALVVTMKALEATLVTVVFDDGQTHDNVLIQNVKHVSTQAGLAAAGGVSAGTVTVIFEITMHITE